LKVLNNIENELSEAVVIAVASRPSLIGMADFVMFFHHETIVGPSQHVELLVQSDSYRALMQAYERPTEQVSAQSMDLL